MFLAGLDYDNYSKLPGVTQTQLKALARSPKHLVFSKSKSSPAQRKGSAFDSFLLTPELFEKEYAVVSDVPRLGSVKRKELDAELGGKSILSEEEYEELSRMKDAVLEQPNCRALLQEEGSSHQFVVTWTDEASGVDCKGRIDSYNHSVGVVVDIKTTKDARSKSFARDSASYGYWFQSRFYTRGCLANSLDVSCCVIIAVESSPPYGVKLYELDSECLRQQDEEIDLCLRTYKDCSDSGFWRGYGEDVEILRYPK